MSSIISKIKHVVAKRQRKIKLNKYFSDASINKIKTQNRKCLDDIDNWITPSTLANSVFRYGIPEGSESLLDQPIDSNLTYTDILVFLSRKLNKPIQYLEIGVSVGKNMYQLLNAFENARMVGMDIEQINPVLAGQLEKIDETLWETNSKLKRSKSSLSKFSYRSNLLWYLSMDEFDRRSWNKLSGASFNIIFSDALHEPSALLFEFDMLQQLGLIDKDEFIMLWDDLGGDMTLAFEEIYNQLSLNNPRAKKYGFVTNGWMNIRAHNIGLITTIDFYS